jgi:glycosyltransferase involved in cell wall biosynthesis
VLRHAPREAARDAGRRGARVSVVIPARDEASRIGRTVAAVLHQAIPDVEIEVIVADDGSVDGTADAARTAGARVVAVAPRLRGSPGAARNLGARASTGDPIVFLDADCVPAPGWLRALLAAHAAGEAAVGGAVDLPAGLSMTARCDHYCGSYHVHPRVAAGYVPNHPPCNLSVRRHAFQATAGFAERLPVGDGHEELAWQAQLRRAGGRIRFEPRAVVYHHDRRGVRNLLRRNFRWGYSAIESKASTGTSRFDALYRRPRLAVAASVPLAFAHTAYTVLCWLRHGRPEPLALLPLVLAARLAYAIGATVGGVRWLRARATGAAVPALPWR